MTVGPTAILFGALFTVAVAWSIGVLLLRRMALPLYREEEPVYAMLLGSAMLAMFVFALCTLHLAYGSVFAVVGAASIAAALLQGARPSGAPLPPMPRPWAVFLGIITAVFLVFYLANAMAPEISPDGMRYHLGLTARYWREHGFRPITTDFYASYSQGMEMLFLFAFAFGRHSAAAVTHLLFLPALAWLMLCHARRHGQPREGVVAVVLVFVSPVVGIDAASAYNDVAVAAVLFAVFSLTEMWIGKRTAALLPVIGLLAGFGYGIKYTAGVAGLYAAGAVVWTLRRQARELARAIAVLAISASLMAAPWMLKNALFVGNPFSPLFNSLFPNPAVDPRLEGEYRARLRMYPGIDSYRQLPEELTINGELLNGLFGPVFLLAPMALLALGSARGRRMLAAVALFGAPYFLNIGTRFLLPALPLAALAMASVAMRFPKAAAVLAAAHVVLCWPTIVGRYAEPQAWRLKTMPWAAALRRVPEEKFLALKVVHYGTAQLIDRKIPPGERVFSISDLPNAYTSHEIVSGSASTIGRRLRRALWTAIFPDLQPRWMARFPFPPGPYRKLRVVQTNRDSATVWSVTEFRVYRGGDPVVLQSASHIEAHPYPADAALAFDNDAVTRWSARDPLHPGMFLGVSFPVPVAADSVLLRYVPDQDKVRLKVEGSLDGRTWITLNDKPECFEGAPPLFLRTMAAQEFLKNGIRYFVITDDDPGKDDFLRNPRLWGITDLGEYNRAHLYRFD